MMMGYRPLRGGSSDTPRLIDEIVVGSSVNTVHFDNLPQGYRHLRLVVAHGQGGAGGVNLRFNDDVGNNYLWIITARRTSNNTAGTLTASNADNRLTVAALGTAGGSAVVDIPGYSLDGVLKTALGTSIEVRPPEDDTPALSYVHHGAWRGTDPITKLTLFSNSPAWAVGTVISLYGLP